MPITVTTEELGEQIGRAVAASVKAYDVPEACVRLGIQSKGEDNDRQEAFGSKRLYVVRRAKGWVAGPLLELAGRVPRENQAPDLQDLKRLTAQMDSKCRGEVSRVFCIFTSALVAGASSPRSADEVRSAWISCRVWVNTPSCAAGMRAWLIERGR